MSSVPFISVWARDFFRRAVLDPAQRNEVLSFTKVFECVGVFPVYMSVFHMYVVPMEARTGSLELE